MGAMDRTNGALLTPAEEVRLAKEIEAGLLAGELLATAGAADASAGELQLLVHLGQRAHRRFVTANLGLAALIARQTADRTGLPYGDLFQEGCLGLMIAVQRFDFARGVKFSTYASCWIRAYVGAAAASAFGALNLPPSRAEQLRAAQGVAAELSVTLGRSASMADLSAALGKSPAWVAELMTYEPPQPLDLIGTEVADGAGEFDAVLDADRPGRELLEHLTGLERRVLEVRLGFTDGVAHSYADTARALGTSTSRVRRLENSALERLRAVCPSGARVHL